jgi:hypothetical protein
MLSAALLCKSVATYMSLLLVRVEELRQFWREAPSAALWRRHTYYGPECLQGSALEFEIACRVSACGRNADVPELVTYRHEIDACLKQRDGAGRSQKMRPHFGREARVGLMHRCGVAR